MSLVVKCVVIKHTLTIKYIIVSSKPCHLETFVAYGIDLCVN